MIIASQALVLKLLETYEANNPVFGWHNLVRAGQIYADYEDENYPASNLANPATNLIWRSTDDGEQYVEFLVDTTDVVNYVGIAGHNFGSSARSVSVERLTNEGDSPEIWEELAPEHMPASDDALLFRFEDQDLLRLRVKLFAGSDVLPEMAVVFIGKLLQMERSFPDTHVPITKNPTTDTVTGESDGGHFLGTIVRKQSLSTNIQFQMLTESWYDDNMQPFIDYANLRNPFFFAWLPYSRPDETGYSWLTQDAAPTYKPQIETVDISLQMNATK